MKNIECIICGNEIIIPNVSTTSLEVSPIQTTTYFVKVTVNGVECIAEKTITVNPNPTAETIGGAYNLKLDKKYQVPANLGQAANLFKDSQSAKDLFGKNFVSHFANTRIWEYEEYKKNKSFFDSSTISLWELQRYFEII